MKMAQADYANSCRLGEKALQAANVVFQPIPWAIQMDGKKARGES